MSDRLCRVLKIVLAPLDRFNFWRIKAPWVSEHPDPYGPISALCGRKKYMALYLNEPVVHSAVEDVGPFLFSYDRREHTDHFEISTQDDRTRQAVLDVFLSWRTDRRIYGQRTHGLPDFLREAAKSLMIDGLAAYRVHWEERSDDAVRWSPKHLEHLQLDDVRLQRRRRKIVSATYIDRHRYDLHPGPQRKCTF